MTPVPMTQTPPAIKDPLLEELNGALAHDLNALHSTEPKSIDFQQEQPPSFASQLETDPHIKPPSPTRTAQPSPKAAQLDKTHARAAGGFGYRVIVEGEYYAKSTETKGHVIKSYRIPFNLPSLVNAKGEAALGIIVGKLLKPALRKFDPLAETYRTHVLVSAEPLNGAPEPTSLQYMAFESLAAYVRENDLPIDPAEYWDVGHLREDVIDFVTNKDSMDGKAHGVKKTVLDRIKERHANRLEEKTLRDMNEGL